jgi:hypothetical protein
MANNLSLSAYEQWGLDLVAALKNEGRGGLAPLTQEARSGAARFASGKGRGELLMIFERPLAKPGLGLDRSH